MPYEWNINDAFIMDEKGEKVVNFKENNLHVVGYSIPVNIKLPLSKLKKNLHSLPNQPDAIPYVTSYYEKNWGFCLTYEKLLSLKDGDYHVLIDSTLEKGSLTYGELLVQVLLRMKFLFQLISAILLWQTMKYRDHL